VCPGSVNLSDKLGGSAA
jgi:hypothetical protein